MCPPPSQALVDISTPPKKAAASSQPSCQHPSIHSNTLSHNSSPICPKGTMSEDICPMGTDRPLEVSGPNSTATCVVQKGISGTL